jgi:hypothetical protein
VLPGAAGVAASSAESALEEQATAPPKAGGPRLIIHLAAHAGFRADAPLFSSISLADGPFDTVDVFNPTSPVHRDPQRRRDRPGAVLAGDELIGLSRAFLSPALARCC